MRFCLVSSLLFVTHFCNCQVVQVSVGVFFWRELTPQFLNFTEVTGGLPNIHYSISSQPFAGLPAWLSFYQRNSSSSGILYGTPTNTDVGRLDVQVIAINRKLYDSVKVIISLNVVEHAMETEYSIKLFIANNNFDTLLMGNNLATFNSVMQPLLQSTELVVEGVVHPTFMGDSLPLPTGGRQYEGVYVIFGNVMHDYERASRNDMVVIMESCRQTDTDLSNLPLHYQETQPFIIDWCKMNLTKTAKALTTFDTDPVVDTTTSTSASSSTERNVVAIILSLILFVIIVIIFFILVHVCYNRHQTQKRVDRLGKKYKKQDIWKSTQSMVIANAQLELREMSSSPPPDKSSLTIPSPSLSPSSDDRQREMIDPPPYQYPPHLSLTT